MIDTPKGSLDELHELQNKYNSMVNTIQTKPVEKVEPVDVAEQNVKEKMIDDVKEASALAKITSMEEWRYVANIFSQEVNIALEKLIQGNNEEARATVNILKKIYEKIDKKASLKSYYLEKYEKKFNKGGK